MKISIIRNMCVGLLVFGVGVASSNAWVKEGHVYCDVNKNCEIDEDDIGVAGVLVVVKNTSGTFSNACWTAADGSFSVQLPNKRDTYVDYVRLDTLPPGTEEITPEYAEFSTSSDDTDVCNDFLIKNPECEKKKACWLTGGGTIRKGKGQPIFSFGGNVNPGCNPDSGDGGNWNVIAHALKLHFQGTTIEVVRCGNVEGVPPGSTSPVTPFNFIEFQGTGTLKGIGGNKANFGQVFFFARAEDLGEPAGGIDRLYLRVFTSTGTTLLLISGAPATPTTVAPIPISTGNLQIHVSSCD